MKKVAIVSVLFLSVWGISFAQMGNGNIILEPVDSLSQGGPRSFVEIPTASLDGSVLTIDLPEATASQVIVSDQNTNAVVYSDSFSSTLQIIIDLENENIGEGNYLLRIYAFGKWWWGEFVIEEED
ncbi:MAG: DUF3244 domain-containing protein [Bacteroidaceae bacterium]|nr:DUF3244 domain-containing protein [Bacteroidaceae bacterium]